MGENECLGWFPRYTQSKPMCNDVGCTTQVWNGNQMPSAEDDVKVNTTSDAKFLTPPSWNFISEGTAEEFNRIVNEYCRTCDECLRKVNEPIDHIIEILAKQPSRRKARKYYKPKFTL